MTIAVSFASRLRAGRKIGKGHAWRVGLLYPLDRALIDRARTQMAKSQSSRVETHVGEMSLGGGRSALICA